MEIENELNDIASELLKHWLDGNVQKEFNLFEMFVKVSSLYYDYSNTSDTCQKDLALASIMTYIEKQFKVPMLSINLDSWLNEKPNHKFIYSIYTRLSDLRDL